MRVGYREGRRCSKAPGDFGPRRCTGSHAEASPQPAPGEAEEVGGAVVDRQLAQELEGARHRRAEHHPAAPVDVHSARGSEHPEPHREELATDERHRGLVEDREADLGGAPLNAAGGGTTVDTFVAKLGPDGAHLWSKRLGTMNVYAFPAVTVDSGGNVIVADPFLGQLDLGGGLLTSQGSQDIFVVKFDPGGAHLWSKRFGDEKDQSGCILKADSTGNLFLVGVFAGQIDLGGGALIAVGSDDTFLVKLDPNGGHLWSQRFGAPNQVTASSDLAVDPTGSILLAGGFTGQVNFGGWSLVSAGKKDIFLMKLTAGGAPVWSRSFGDAADQLAYGVATDGTGNVFVVGDLNSATDFGQGALVSAGSSDVFVAKFTP